MQALGADLISSSLLAYLPGNSDKFCPSEQGCKFEVASSRLQVEVASSHVRSVLTSAQVGSYLSSGRFLPQTCNGCGVSTISKSAAVQALGADLISLSYLSYLSISSLLAYLGGISDNFCPSGNKKFEVASLRQEMTPAEGIPT